MCRNITFSALVLAALSVAAPASAATPDGSADGAAAAPEPALNAQFATLIGAALDKAIDADALDAGVPVALVELIKARYPQANNQAPLLATYSACAATFDERWRAYDERRTLVDQAVATANELGVSERYADAMAALEAVITPVEAPEADHLGRLAPIKREVLEVRDADLPAVTALAVLAVQQRQLQRLPVLRIALLARRRVSASAPPERLAWLASQCGESVHKSQGRFYGFAAGQKNEVMQAVEAVLAYAGRADTDGASMVSGFVRTLPDLGVTFVELGTKADLDKGAWVVLAVAPTKVAKKSVSYKHEDQWTEAYDCAISDKIDGIDPRTGRFHYALKCKTRAKREVITLAASVPDTSMLKKAGPAGYPKVWIVGKIKTAGPKWSLTDAQLIDLPAGTDLRFLSPSL